MSVFEFRRMILPRPSFRSGFLSRPWVFLIFIFAAFGVAHSSAEAPDKAEISTGTLKILDMKGMPRLVISTNNSGGPVVHCLGSDKSPRLLISTSDEGADLSVYDRRGDLRSILSVSGEDGDVSISQYRIAAELAPGDNAKASEFIVGSDSLDYSLAGPIYKRIRVSPSEDRNIQLTVLDGVKKRSIAIEFVQEDMKQAIRVKNDKGDTVWSLPVN